MYIMYVYVVVCSVRNVCVVPSTPYIVEIGRNINKCKKKVQYLGLSSPVLYGVCTAVSESIDE